MLGATPFIPRCVKVPQSASCNPKQLKDALGDTSRLLRMMSALDLMMGAVTTLLHSTASTDVQLLLTCAAKVLTNMASLLDRHHVTTLLSFRDVVLHANKEDPHLKGSIDSARLAPSIGFFPPSRTSCEMQKERGYFSKKRH